MIRAAHTETERLLAIRRSMREQHEDRLARPEGPEFDLGQLVALSYGNVSARQLQWWDERGFIRPEHRKHRRYYSPAQAALALVCGELLKKGYSLQRCRKLRAALIKAILGAATQTERTWLVTDGRRVDWVATLDKVCDFQQDRPITFFYLTPALRMVGL